MENPLPVSNNPREGKQGRRLYYRIKTSIQQSGLSIAELQPGLEYPGTGLEDDIAAILKKYSKLARGIVTPDPASLTGLIRTGWSVNVKNGVAQDFPEGDVELANVDYVCPLGPDDGNSISYDTMMQRAIRLGAIGSLGYAAKLLKAQEEGKEIFPVESCGEHYFIMPRTELLDVNRGRRVAYFYWVVKSRRWVLDFGWGVGNFSRHVRFLVPREKKPLAA